MKDAAIEPDLALNYDELGDIYWLMEDDTNAEKSYREALRRDPRLVNSRLGLAKIYQRQQKYAPALAEIEDARQSGSGTAPTSIMCADRCCCIWDARRRPRKNWKPR